VVDLRDPLAPPRRSRAAAPRVRRRRATAPLVVRGETGDLDRHA
jgi:hypothetical protein